MTKPNVIKKLEKLNKKISSIKWKLKNITEEIDEIEDFDFGDILDVLEEGDND